MQEYILLPKATYDRYTNTGQKTHSPIPKPKSHINTQLPTYTHKAPPLLKLQPVNGPSTNNPTTKPDLSQVIPLYTTQSNENYLKTLLTQFIKIPHITWDSSGNLISPIQSINILKLLRSFINKNGRLPAEDVGPARVLLNLTQINPEHIKNGIVRKQIYGGGSRSSRTKQEKNPVWIPY